MPLRKFSWLLILAVLLSTAACQFTANEAPSAAAVFTGAPVIQMNSPLAGSVYREGTPVNILARVENAGTDIGFVEVRVGDEVIARSENPNTSGAAAFTLTVSWTATQAGNQTIRVEVQRANMPNERAIQEVTIEVRATTQPTPTATNTELPTLTPTITPETAAATTAPTTASSGTTDTGAQAPTVDSAAAQPTATTAAPTATSAPPTTSQPTVTVAQGANVRQGPGTSFIVLGTLAAGESRPIVGKSPDGTWYKIQFYNSPGWISASVVTVAGDTSTVPVDAGPPTPIVQPTAIPPTAAPASNVDLIIDGVPSIGPHPFVCNQASEIFVTVKNVGTARSEGGRIAIIDIYNGGEVTRTEGVFGPLEPGATQRSGPIFLTISSNYNEGHATRFVVDSANQIAESNENNNQTEIPYVLQKGACP
jgi:uncharacterized protein YraI